MNNQDNDELVTADSHRLAIEDLEGLSSEICTICQYRFLVREYVRGLSCGHGFHLDCFKEWVITVRSQE